MISLNQLSHLENDIKGYYKRLHTHPELGFEEVKTSAFIAKKLEEFGLDVTKNVGRTGVVGVLKGGGSDKTIMLRADMDGLPIDEESNLKYSSTHKGRMHACGHDAHVSMLLGACKYLSENKDQVNGNVKFVFQPAEEGPAPGGASLMIGDGVLENVDACLAIHVSSRHETGQLMVQEKEAMAATDFFKIEIVGQGGHGSAPHQSIDPIPAMTSILSSINQFSSREIDPMTPCVVSIGTVNTVSSSWNIIPEKIEITGTFRTFSEDIRSYINKRIKEISETTAKSHRCSTTYTRGEGYKPTINNGSMVNHVITTAKEYIDENNIFLEPKPFTGGEDVGAYFEKVPGALIWLGCSKEVNSQTADLHNPRFTVDLDSLVFGTQVHINNVISFLK